MFLTVWVLWVSLVSAVLALALVPRTRRPGAAESGPATAGRDVEAG